MKEVWVNGLKLLMYNSIEELPAIRFQKYNEFLLTDSGIGSDINAIVRQNTLIIEFIKKGSTEKAIQQLQNMNQTFHFIISNMSPEMASFVVLIKSIDGKDNDDISEDGIKRTLERLSKRGLTLGKIRQFLLSFSDKISGEFETIFPATNSAKAKETFSLIRKRTLAIIDKIKGLGTDADVQKINHQIYELINPKKFSGADGLEVKMIKSFTDICVMLSQHLMVPDPKNLSTLQFYRSLELLEKQFADNKKINGKRRQKPR